MNLTIFGATGKTGLHLVKQALERNNQVTAFVRNPDILNLNNQKLQIIQGDIIDSEIVDRAVAQVDAVLSVLGPTENKPTYTVSKGTENILHAMEKHQVKRLVISAGAGVSDPKDKPGFLDKIIQFLLKRFSRYVLEDMQQTVEIVRNSDLEWTIVRVPMLTDAPPTGEVKAGYIGGGIGPRVNRSDLASFMLDQLDDPTYVRQAPAISN